MSARIVTLHLDSEGTPFLAAGSPHASGDRRRWLAEALRRDLSPLFIEPAARVFRPIPKAEPYPHPETCAPYQDANGLGFTLRLRLPLLFVKTLGGELLADARTSLAYARENESEFQDVLQAIGNYAAAVLDAEVVRRHAAEAPLLFRDLVQPYRTFARGFFSIPAGFYTATSSGIATVIGPPLNRPPLLLVKTGLVETEWHQRPHFVVIEYPSFNGRSLLIPPGHELAQVYFVSFQESKEAVVEHRAWQVGGEPAYEARWTALTNRLVDSEQGVIARYSGVASVTLECLHCRTSVTSAAEGQFPDWHETEIMFLQPYKCLQREQSKRKEENHE
jgi:hypothetical protein